MTNYLGIPVPKFGLTEQPGIEGVDNLFTDETGNKVSIPITIDCPKHGQSEAVTFSFAEGLFDDYCICCLEALIKSNCTHRKTQQ